jgi:acyl carrier protein
MTQSTQQSMRNVVLQALARIAPEADLTSLDATGDIREQLDLDSVDFLNFVVALDNQLGVEVPEADYAKLRTLDGCLNYLAAAAVS